MQGSANAQELRRFGAGTESPECLGRDYGAEMRTSRGIDSGDLTSNIRGLIDYLSDQKK